MEEHNSYHEEITGEEAEKRLRKKGGHCYLTRYNKASHYYILSVFKPQQPRDVVRHFKIVMDNGRKRIDGLDKEFRDVASLLEHYEHWRIDPGLRSIGQACTEAEYNGAVEQQERPKKRCVIQ